MLNRKPAYRIAYITSIYPPTTGGAATYVDILSKAFVDKGICDQFHILTEFLPKVKRYSIENGAKIFINRTLIPVTSIENKFIKYLGFPLKALQLGFIKNFFLLNGINGVFIHASMLRYPSLLSYSLKALKKSKSVKFIIVDARDPNFSTSVIKKFVEVGCIISCADNITKKLNFFNNNKIRIFNVPVPLHVISPDYNGALELLRCYGIEQKSFILNPNGLFKHKGYELVMEAWEHLVSREININLITVGSGQSLKKGITFDSSAGKAAYLGSIKHEILLGLMGLSSMVINVGQSEGVPRTVLESIELKIPVIMPGNINEFDKIDNRFKYYGNGIGELVYKIKAILEGNAALANYDISKHYIENLVEKYNDIIHTCEISS